MNTPSRRAFTLIELLVVIAIIAILAAILFPVFAQAKAAAKQSVTLSNMKQTMTAIMMYENDYEDVLPQVYTGDFGVTEYYWTLKIQPYAKNLGVTFSGTRPMPQSIEGEAVNESYVKPGYDRIDWYGNWAGKTSMGMFNNVAGYRNSATSTPVRVASSVDYPAERSLVAPTGHTTIKTRGWSRSSAIADQGCVPNDGSDKNAGGGTLNFAIVNAAKEHNKAIVTGWMDGHASRKNGMIMWDCDKFGPKWQDFIAREDVKLYWSVGYTF